LKLGHFCGILTWSSEDLPGHFAVWAASDEARFLHGRWVAAHWDVDKLKGSVAKALEEDRTFGRIGLLGINGDK